MGERDNAYGVLVGIYESDNQWERLGIDGMITLNYTECLKKLYNGIANITV
jgi:hypothetical protein